MNKWAIVSVATGDFYVNNQERMLARFIHCVDNVTRYYEDRTAEWDTGKHFGIDLLLWTDRLPPNSRSHYVSPYGFKVHAIQHAYEKGYSVVLWLDSPAYPVKKDISPIFRMIEEKGYYAMSHTDPLNGWTSDHILEKFQMSRDDIKDKNLPSGSCYGFKDGTSPVFNRMKLCERNDYFESHVWEGGAHRHDETILALLLIEEKLPIFTFDKLFQSKEPECCIRSGASWAEDAKIYGE